MNTMKNMVIAFGLNLSFSLFEFIGGFLTGSIAIVSDAIHDMGDAVSIGLCCFLEKKSKRKPDCIYTYGYGGFSVLGGCIGNLILILGAVAVIYNAICKIIDPVTIHYDGMIFFSLIGMIVNFVAALVTHKGDSLNQKAVNLHMLEDVLGWAVVLVGATIMKFTGIIIIDPIMSIGVSLFIFVSAMRGVKESVTVWLGKVPDRLSVEEINGKVRAIDGVEDVHHLHLWSNDGQNVYATMHIVTEGEAHSIKEKVREKLRVHGIHHVTLELETNSEDCFAKTCSPNQCQTHHHHHHHH